MDICGKKRASTYEGARRKSSRTARVRGGREDEADFFSLLAIPGADEPSPQDVQGEERIARLLSELGPRWTRLHDRLLGPAWNLDHLLVGPPGVFALNARDVRGKVWIAGDTCLLNGEPTAFVAQARRDALEVRQRLEDATGLELCVESLIVFVQPDNLTVERHPWGATALSDDALLAWLRAQPPAEDGRVQEILAHAARRDSTWHWH